MSIKRPRKIFGFTRGLKGDAVEGPDPELRVDGRGGMIGTSATRGGSDEVEGGICDGGTVGREAVAVDVVVSTWNKSGSGCRGKSCRLGGGL